MNSTLIAITILVAAPAPKEVPKKEPPSILGVWVAESALIAGKPDPPPAGTTMTFEKEGKAFMKEGGDDKPEEMGYTLDAAKGHIDLTEGRGGKKEAMKGIFKIDGDTLTICITMKGDRPTEFTSPAGSPNILLTLKKAKKE